MIGCFSCPREVRAWLDGRMAYGGTVVVTGTDTGVGKTVLTALLTRALIETGGTVAALKPISSGNRVDGRRLRAAVRGTLTLDEVNPWWFRAPLTPMLAARKEGRRVRLPAVLRHLRAMRRRFDWVVVEGAGGLLSPLGEDFDTRALIVAMRARVIVVGVNRLGVINQVLLTLRALPRRLALETRTILMQPRRLDLSSRSNPAVLRDMLGAERVAVLPRLKPVDVRDGARGRPEIRGLVSWLVCGEPIRNGFSEGPGMG